MRDDINAGWGAPPTSPAVNTVLLFRPHQKYFLLPVAKVEKDRVGRSVKNLFFVNILAMASTQYPPDAEQQCSTPILDYTFIVFNPYGAAIIW